ncbi:MAG: cyclic pyranopterin monophosphate synthase MoaC [Firmicutes bacterium]|nr:cyclic pyranopterin monophosphate synthase MoaC [Bacillota bacterium]
MNNLTHLNDQGRAKMVDVSVKADTKRVAVASGVVRMRVATLQCIVSGGLEKGDVLAIAQVAGIMAAKQTSHLIPMCHPLFLTAVDIHFVINEKKQQIEIAATVSTTGKTGVEMEALTAVSVTALTIYDMCKAIDKEMIIADVMLLEKSGGKSGHFKRNDGVEGGSHE